MVFRVRLVVVIDKEPVAVLIVAVLLGGLREPCKYIFRAVFINRFVAPVVCSVALEPTPPDSIVRFLPTVTLKDVPPVCAIRTSAAGSAPARITRSFVVVIDESAEKDI